MYEHAHASMLRKTYEGEKKRTTGDKRIYERKDEREGGGGGSK